MIYDRAFALLLRSTCAVDGHRERPAVPTVMSLHDSGVHTARRMGSASRLFCLALRPSMSRSLFVVDLNSFDYLAMLCRFAAVVHLSLHHPLALSYTKHIPVVYGSLLHSCNLLHDLSSLHLLFLRIPSPWTPI